MNEINTWEERKMCSQIVRVKSGLFVTDDLQLCHKMIINNFPINRFIRFDKSFYQVKIKRKGTHAKLFVLPKFYHC